MEPGRLSELVQNALYTLGEECGLLLMDWNRLKMTDLASKTQLRSWLSQYRK